MNITVALDLIISSDIFLAKVMQFVRQATRIMAYQLALSIIADTYIERFIFSRRGFLCVFKMKQYKISVIQYVLD